MNITILMNLVIQWKQNNFIQFFAAWMWFINLKMSAFHKLFCLWTFEYSANKAIWWSLRYGNELYLPQSRQQVMVSSQHCVWTCTDDKCMLGKRVAWKKPLWAIHCGLCIGLDIDLTQQQQRSGYSYTYKYSARGIRPRPRSTDFSKNMTDDDSWSVADIPGCQLRALLPAIPCQLPPNCRTDAVNIKVDRLSFRWKNRLHVQRCAN
jgi:hypothetical protein